MKGVQPLKTKTKTKQQLPTAAAQPTKKQREAQKEHFQRKQQHALGTDSISSLRLGGLSDHYSADHHNTLRSDYLNPLCGTDVLRNLKKGRWDIMASIDLHGATLDQARVRLEYFLQHSLAEGYKCVRIVHGMGYGSKDRGPVLPITVRRWLAQLDSVLAYTDCKPQEGGSGAVKVLLRQLK